MDLAAQPDQQNTLAGVKSPFSLRQPAGPAPLLVYACPHAGRDYPPDLRAELALRRLRKLEHAYVDQVLENAPALGAPLIVGNIGRGYIDLNRDPAELDPRLIDGFRSIATPALTPRVAAGLGVIPRLADGAEIYKRRLGLDEVLLRIEHVHAPYHQALDDLVQRAHGQHGCAILIDWHSMPASAAAQGAERGRRAPDFVLGDRRGVACWPTLTDFIDGALRDLGYTVGRNNPYAGGYTTERHGRPDVGVQTLQIEISRALYLDEVTLTLTPGFERLQRNLDRLTRSLLDHAPDLAVAQHPA